MSKRSAQRHRKVKHELEGEQRIAGNGYAPVLELEPTASTTQLLDNLSAHVERVVGVDESRQPRFNLSQPQGIFNSIFNWVKIASLKDEPRRTASVREMDKWLREFVLQEPYLAGVYNSVVQIDKNRGWNLIGGRNQVLRYSQILHNADNGTGWRNYITWQAQSFYSTRAGFVTEVGSDGEGGPLRALWSVDSARIDLMPSQTFPLRYFPMTGEAQDWRATDYFRGASLTSIDEAKCGYGFPANARNFDLAKIMVAIWEHDKEQLAAAAPRGLLLLRGISQDQWDTAMQARAESLTAHERMYYGGIATLAASGVEEIDAKLFALSTLPKDFSLKEWVSLLMYGYALSYGYDAREFFPVDSGSLGSAKETEVQHRKASSKGDLDFSLAHQEQLQGRLPDTLQFEYEQRDALGEQLDSALALSKAQVITEINKWVVSGANVINAEQIIQLAAQAGIVPEEWTEQEENVTVDDSAAAEIQERAFDLPRVQRALLHFPQEPIVQYESRTDRIRVLYDPHGIRRSYFSIKGTMWLRRTVAEVRESFCDELHGMVTQYWRSGRANVANEMRALLTEYIEQAYLEGAKEGGVSSKDLDEDDAANIDRLIFEQTSRVEGFIDAVKEARADKELRSGVEQRAELWCNAVQAAGASGLNTARANEMVEFAGDDGDEMCETCASLKGKRHRRKWWDQHGLVPGQPGNTNFKCGGYKCKHELIPVTSRMLSTSTHQGGSQLAISATDEITTLRQVAIALAQRPVNLAIEHGHNEPTQQMVDVMKTVLERPIAPQPIHIHPQAVQVSPQIIMREQSAPIVNVAPAQVTVNVPQQSPPQVTVEAPKVTVLPAQVHVTNEVATPDVTITNQVAPPEINVTTPAPIVNIEVPIERTEVMEVERGADGLIDRIFKTITRNEK